MDGFLTRSYPQKAHIAVKIVGLGKKYRRELSTDASLGFGTLPVREGFSHCACYGNLRVWKRGELNPLNYRKMHAC